MKKALAYKILIAEDELFSAEYLKRILEKSNYDVVDIVTKGSLVITKAQELQPDLILMDIMLADKISGAEAALIIKQTNPEIGIIFITAYADSEMLEYASESNTYGYLLKPYKEMEILANIKIALSKIKHAHNTITDNSDKLFINSQLFYDSTQNKLFLNNDEIILNTRAKLIVEILSKNLNSIVSNEQICNYAWGGKINNITLRTTINRIRKLVDKDFITSIRGHGYMIKNKHIS